MVEEAVLAKKFVVVADVPVAFKKVKFWRVEEELTKRFSVERSVVEAVIALKSAAKKLVEVALVEVEYVAKVEEAMRERGEPVSQRPVEVALTIWPL